MRAALRAARSARFVAERLDFLLRREPESGLGGELAGEVGLAGEGERNGPTAANDCCLEKFPPIHKGSCTLS